MNRLEKLIESLMETKQEDSMILASVLGRFCIVKPRYTVGMLHQLFSVIFFPDPTRTCKIEIIP